MALQIVTQLRDLAQDEHNRQYIVKDQGCLPALIPHLDCSDEEVIYVTLEALHFLSLCHANRSVMAREDGLVPALKKLVGSKNPNIKRKAMSTFVNLQGYTKTRNQKSSTTTPLSDRKDNLRISSAKTYTLYVKGLSNDNNRKDLETALLQTKGVVSFLIDLYGQKAVVRSMIPGEAVAAAVNKKTNMTASLSKQSPIYASPEEEENREPSYLEESQEELEEVGAGAMVRTTEPSQEAQPTSWGWGFGRISKALWG